MGGGRSWHRTPDFGSIVDADRGARWHEILRGSIHTWFSDFMRALKSTRPDAASPVRVKLPTLHQGEPGLTAAYR
jgi:hypothetical protein